MFFFEIGYFLGKSMIDDELRKVVFLRILLGFVSSIIDGYEEDELKINVKKLLIFPI